MIRKGAGNTAPFLKDEHMKILIVSGFLGAGKTTFIKELIQHMSVRPVIMENEYGETDLDSQDLKQSVPEQKDMKILEFMEGCVCCTMKDRFVNSVLTIFSGLDPEYLVIEPTGVGRLSNILKNLKPILHDSIILLKPVVIISPGTYDYNMSEWPELYSDQISNAGTVVLSKVESEDPADLEDAAAKIRKINPDAEIVTRHYSTEPDEWWQDLMMLPVEKTAVIHETPDGVTLDQVTIQTAKLSRPSELILFLEDLVNGELGNIARAKGVIPVGNEMFRFDLADRQYAMTGAAESKTQCVFIGTGLNEEALYRRLGTNPEEEKLHITTLPFSSQREHHQKWKKISLT